MGLIDIAINRGNGGGSYSTGDIFAIKAGKLKGIYIITIVYERPASIIGGSLSVFGFSVTKMRDGFVVRSTQAFPPTGILNTAHIIIQGNFNYDEIEYVDMAEFPRRVEVRNENGVLITDNGLPFGDGTYPPDAKNRAGLAGLHAAPIASNNEFADLSGLDPNKEAEMIGGERGEGMQYALERNEDNGL